MDRTIPRIRHGRRPDEPNADGRRGIMMRMNADAAASVVQVLDAAQQNLNSLANVAAGVGQNVNISA